MSIFLSGGMCSKSSAMVSGFSHKSDIGVTPSWNFVYMIFPAFPIPVFMHVFVSLIQEHFILLYIIYFRQSTQLGSLQNFPKCASPYLLQSLWITFNPFLIIVHV